MSSSTRRGSKSPRIVLSPEQLEDRTNPAGNVTVIQEGGVLHIWGDSADNRIWVAGAGDDTAVIVTLDGTTLNGARVPLWYTGIKFAYDIKLHGGNDFLYVSGLTGSAGLFALTGDGNDGVAADNMGLDGANVITTGNGDDRVSVGMGKMKWASFALGTGEDRLFIVGTEFGDVVFSGGNGANDTMSLTAIKWGSFPHTSGFEAVFSTLMPIANNDRFKVERGESVTLNVLANDRALSGIFDPSTVRITKQPDRGTATVNDDGTITYTAPSGLSNGTDSLRYTVRTSTGAISNEATVTLVFPVIPDTTGPAPTITTPAGDNTNLTAIPFRITFNENVTGFDATDITVTNGTASGFAVDPANPRSFTFTVTPTAPGAVTVSVAAGAAQDKKGNDSSAASKTVTFDNAGATPTISSSEPDPTNAESIPISVVFSEAVTEFTLADVVVTNGTASNFQGSGTTYTFSIDPTANGPVTVNIAAGAALDLAQNPSLAATEFTIVSDTSGPSVQLSTSAGTPTNLAEIPFQAVFSEAVTGFVSADITVTNGTVVNFQGSGTTYTFGVQPTADGDVTVSIAANVALDLGGNGNTAATPITRVSDRTVPTATVATSEPDPTSNNPMEFSVTFSEAVTGFTAGDILVVNGAVSNFQGSGTSFTFDVVPSGTSVLVSVSVPAGVAEDSAANGNAVSNTITRQFNGTTVSTELSTTSTDPTNDLPIQITVVFGEAVTGFELADINVTNGAASNLQGSGASYTFDVTPTADGPVVVDVVAAAATGDVSGDPTSAAQLTITSDTTAPAPTITGPGSPSNDSPMQFSIQFGEDVTGFDLADINVTNGAASNLQGSAGSFTFDVTPTADGDVVVSVPAAAATDAAGNDSTASNTVTIVSDTTAPTVVVATTESDPTSANPIPFTATFSEDVTGFDATKIDVTNGTVTNFVAVNGSTYTFNVVPSASNVTISVSVAAGVAQDAATNVNTASNTVTITFNGTIVTTTIATTATDPTNLSPIPFTATFSENVTGFDLTDISVANGTASNLQGSGASYTFDVTPTADGLVSVEIAAGAATGDVSGGSTGAASASITSDTTAPGATITGPASPSNDSPMQFSIQFSEGVTGFELTDIDVTNGVASNLQGTGASFTFDVTPTADGDVTVTVAAGVAADAAGNNNTAATPVTVVSDTTAPTVAIATTATNPTHLSPIPLTVTFSEDVTGFDSGDLIVTNGTVSNFAGSGAAYTFDLTPTADGPITVNIAAGVAADSAGNANLAAPEFAITSIRTDAGMTDTIPDINAMEWQTIGTEGLKFWDVQTGTGTAVTSGSTVTVFYTGWLLDGTVFDSARTTGSPATFPLSNLIQGWQQGLLGMQPGGIRRLYIPSELAYGSTGSGSVPPNADLVFEIKLVFTT